MDNGDGTFTFTDAAGTVVTWSETLTSLAQDDITGNITYTDENGVATTAEILSTDAGNLLTVGSDGGTYLDLATIPVTETTTTLVDNGDGTFTYTNEDGIAVTIDSKGTLVDNGDGTFTFTDAAGTVVTWSETLTSLAQDDITGIITYTDENGVATTAEIISSDAGNLISAGADGGTYLDVTAIPNNETITTLTDNGNGTFTYTSENGTITNFDAKGTLMDNGNGTFTFTDAGGNITTFDSKGTLVDNGDGTFTFTDAAGTVVTWSETLTSLAQDNLTGNITYTDENGVATTAEIISSDAGNLISAGADGGTYLDVTAIPNNETITTLTDNGNGTFTYTSENGTITNFDAKGTLMDNGDGTFTFTDAGGNITTFDAKGTLVDNGDGTFTFTDAAGTVVTWSETLTSLAQDNLTGNITYTDENGVATTAEIISSDAGNLISAGADGGTYLDVTAIPNNETITTLTDNGNGTFTYTSENGTITNFDAKGTLMDNGDGTFTFTDAAGTVVTWSETLTSLAQDNLTGNITYTDENGVATTAEIISSDAGNLISAGADGGTYLDVTAIPNNETITTLTDNGNGTFTYTSENGTITNFDAKGTLVDNGDGTFTFTDAAGTVVTWSETLTSLTQDNLTGNITYTDENGVATTAEIISSDAGNLISAGADGGTYLDASSLPSETITTLTDNGNGTFTYTSENGTITNFDAKGTLMNNGDGTFTFTDAGGNITTFDAKGTLTDNGDGTFTFTDAAGSVVTWSETLTSLAQDNLTGNITYTNENGVATTAEIISSDAGNLISAGADGGTYLDASSLPSETITTLVNNGNGTFTYTSENGTITNFDAKGTLVDNGDGTFTFTDAAGTVVTWSETLTSLTQDNLTGNITYTDENGVATTAEIISSDAGNLISAGADGGTYLDASSLPSETITTLTDNGNGTFTYTSENGTITNFDAKGTLMNNGDGTFTFTDAGGNITTFDAKGTLTDNGDGTFTFTDAAGTVVTWSETLTSLTQDNLTGNITYTDENGVATTAEIISSDAGNLISAGADGGTYLDVTAIPNNETITTLTDNGNGTFTYTSENGTITNFDAKGTLVDNGDGTFTFTDAAGTVVTWSETLTSLAQDNLTGNITYTDENGLATTAEIISSDAGNLISAGADGGTYLDASSLPSETITTLTDNGNGTFTYTSENGTITNFDAKGTLMDNGNGTFTFTDAGGNITTFDAKGTLTDNGDGTFTFTDAAGSVVTWSETLTSLAQDNLTGNITYTDENGLATTAEIISSDAGNLISAGADGGTYLDASSLPSETITTLTDNGNGTFTYTSENGTITNFDAKGTLMNNGDGTFTFTDAGGNITTFDAKGTLTDNGDGTFTFTDAAGTVVTWSETLTSLAQDNLTGNITYTDENGVATTAEIISSDAGNLISAGADGGTYLDASSLPSETITTLTDNGNGTFTYTSENGTITNFDAKGTLMDNGDGTFTFTDAGGNITTFDAKGTLTDNGDGTFTFTDAAGTVVTWSETLTSLAQDNLTGNITYTDENGVATTAEIISSDAGNLISAGADGGTYLDASSLPSETITTLTDNGNGTFTYTSENGTITNFDAKGILMDNGDGTFTFTDAGGNITTFDAKGTLTDNGDGTFTFTDAAGTVVTWSETLTSLAQDDVTGNITYTDENGVATTAEIISSDAGNLISAGADGGTYLDASSLPSETITTLTDNGNGTFTYTSENGTITNFDAKGTLMDNGDGTFTFTDAGGNITTFDAKGTLVDNGDGTFTFTDAAGTVVTWSETLTSLAQDDITGNITYTDENGVATTAEIISSDAGNLISAGADGGTYLDVTAIPNNETITTLTDNGNGTFTYTSENGTITNFDAKGTLVDNGDGTFTFTDAAGTVVTWSETLTSLTQDNLTGNITYTDENGLATTAEIISSDAGNLISAGADGGTYLDVTAIPNNETITTLTDNGNGTFTYTSENGTITNFDAKGTLVDNGNGTFTFTDAGGNITTFDAKGTLTDNGDGTFTFTDAAGTVVTWSETLTSLAQDNLTGNITYTDENGLATTAEIISSDAGNLISAGADGGTYLDASSLPSETITTLTDNGNGTFTYTSENGTITNFDAKGTLVDNGDGTFTFTDAAGTVVTWSETLTSLAQDNLTGNITYTDENGLATTAEIISSDAGNLISAGADGGTYLDASSLPSETITTLTDNGNGTFTYTSENGTITNFDAKGTLVDNGDGTFTFTDAAGTVVTWSETLTSLTQDNLTGNITYTDENGVATTAEIISSDAGNLISAGADGGTYLDASSLPSETITTLVDNTDGSFTYTSEDGTVTDWNETTTSLSQNNTSGVVTYTNEDGTITTADVVSSDAANLISVGADGGSFLNAAALPSETITTLVDNNNGTYTYTSEDASTSNIDLDVWIDVNKNIISRIASTSNINGTGIISLGYQSFNAPSGATSNVIAIGKWAAQQMTVTGTAQVNAIGYTAALKNAGINLNALGAAAGWHNIGNSVNVMGNQAGYSNTGSNVNGFGVNAVKTNTGSGVNAFGELAGFQNEGSNVNGFGYKSVYNNTGNYVNTIGFEAGRDNTGDYVTGIGYQAAYDITSDYVNVIGNWQTDPGQDGATILVGDLFLKTPNSGAAPGTGNYIYFNDNANANIHYDNSIGEIFAADAAGNVTQISPHHFELMPRSHEMAWSFYSTNKDLKQQVNVDMMKAMRLLEELSGVKLVYLADMDGNDIPLPEEKLLPAPRGQNSSNQNLTEEIAKLQKTIEQLQSENSLHQEAIQELRELIKKQQQLIDALLLKVEKSND